jgi:hypothetical protein
MTELVSRDAAYRGLHSIMKADSEKLQRIPYACTPVYVGGEGSFVLRTLPQVATLHRFAQTPKLLSTLFFNANCSGFLGRQHFNEA